jgi:2-iminobutanoate/2-iminopropanoate deaminase
VGNLVFVAGQIPMDKQARIPMRDFRAQTEQVFQNLKGVLDEIGATFDDIVRERGYIVNLSSHEEGRPEGRPSPSGPSN